MSKINKTQNVRYKIAKSKTGLSTALFRVYILHFIFYIFLLPSCYEPREGCLDIRARDFQVDADDPCADCCTYPELTMNFLHKAGVQDTFFNLVYLDSVYNDSADNPFRINDIQFFISNLRVVNLDGEEIGVAERLEISVQLPNDEIELDSIEDNFALVSPGDFRASTIGTFAQSGTYNKIRFTLGIEEPANSADPEELPEDHPLTTPEMYWSADSGYVFNRIELFKDTIATDTIPVLVEIGGEGETQEIEFDFGQTFFLDDGFNLELTLRVDYLSWFNTVNVKTDSEEEMAIKIVEQLAESFSLIAVESN